MTMKKFFQLLAFALPTCAQVQMWQQCGGIGYSGATNCVSGAACTVVNAYYFQCLPGAAPAPPPPSTGAVTLVLNGGLNVMADGTYPRATRLQDGSILGVHTSFQSGQNVIAAVRSTDNGVTWTFVGEVTRGVGDIDNPFAVQLSNGRILCAFRNHTRNPSGGYLYYRITVCYSDNGGASWSYLSTPDQNGNPVTGLWEPFLRNANDGSLQIYYSRENAANDQDSIQRISYDGGATWSAANTISGAGITARDGMLGLATFNDGVNKLLAVFETTEDGPFCIKSVTSSDDGQTWGNRQLVYAAPGSYVANAPQVANVGGTLIVTFMTNEDGNGTGIKMIVQTGIGPGWINWGNKILVGPVTSSWGGVLTIDNSDVLAMVDNGGCKAQKVTLDRS